MEKYILVVEDDLQIQELIIEFLKSEGYIVDAANDGIEAYKKVKNSSYNLIILDVMMPNMDGYTLCKMIREFSNIPIIFLTALESEFDEIKAFDLECDDFITKPFSFNILIRRVEAVLKRYNKLHIENNITFENLKLECDSYKGYFKEKEIELTLKEFNILKMLIEYYPRVVTREILMDKVWVYDYYGDMRVIDAHIKNIRKKIDAKYIKTIKGIGYVLGK
ncbi:response regulator transcription factor [Clostridium senegalense]|uniref:response regulator transcription factor n=1 Tax=Clostridium senegalense TaxID=1465809 RepID=UPI000288D590|nr:response regulator transcription factor [Clostridium senegalense]